MFEVRCLQLLSLLYSGFYRFYKNVSLLFINSTSNILSMSESHPLETYSPIRKNSARY